MQMSFHAFLLNKDAFVCVKCLNLPMVKRILVTILIKSLYCQHSSASHLKKMKIISFNYILSIACNFYALGLLIRGLWNIDLSFTFVLSISNSKAENIIQMVTKA